MKKTKKGNKSTYINGYMRIDSYDEEKTIKIASIYKEVLEILGEDPQREGLLLTPERVAKSLQFLTQGYVSNPEEILKSAMFEEDYKEMVIVKDIDIFSMCEHHMIPFIGKAHVAYIPDRYITGLSKIARIVDMMSRKPQLQERLTSQIADTLNRVIQPMGVAVVVEAEHLCMTMRGVKKPGSLTVTSALRGLCKKDARSRAEAMALIHHR